MAGPAADWPHRVCPLWPLLWIFLLAGVAHRQPAHQIAVGPATPVRCLADAVNGVHPMARPAATAAPDHAGQRST
jgi:hypothetical protein